jgi:hypothetical protein
MFALITKCAFDSRPKLGLEALVKDNSFFGNNPDEKIDRRSTSFIIKTRVMTMYEEKEVCQLIYQILLETASVLDLSNLPEEEVDKVIKHNLIPVDQLISSFYPTTTIQKGRRQILKKKRPNPIRASPLFLREEIRIISDITSYLYRDQDQLLSAGYTDYVYTFGFAATKRKINQIITSRWEILQRFAHVTKIRLQDIRNNSRDKTLKKATVQPVHVSSLLQSLPDPAKRLQEEILHIVGRNLSEIYQSSDIDPIDPDLYLYAECFECYQILKLPQKPSKDISPEKAKKVFEHKVYKTVRDALKDVNHRLAVYYQRIENIMSLARRKVFGRYDELTGLINNIAGWFETNRAIKPSKGADLAVQIHAPFNASWEGFFQTHQEAFSKSLFELDKRLRVSAKLTQDQAVKRVLAELLKALASCIERMRSYAIAH